MSDLLEQLRTAAAHEYCYPSMALVNEAADTIEQQQAEIERLGKRCIELSNIERDRSSEINTLEDDYNRLQEQRLQLETDVLRLKQAADIRARRQEELEKDVARLEKALTNEKQVQEGLREELETQSIKFGKMQDEWWESLEGAADIEVQRDHYKAVIDSAPCPYPVRAGGRQETGNRCIYDRDGERQTCICWKAKVDDG